MLLNGEAPEESPAELLQEHGGQPFPPTTKLAVPNSTLRYTGAHSTRHLYEVFPHNDARSNNKVRFPRAVNNTTAVHGAGNGTVSQAVPPRGLG